MVTIRYAGGLGENLFQYAFGRVLAERFGYQLKAAPLWSFPNTRQPVEGRTFFAPESRWTGTEATDWQTGEPLREEELERDPRCKLILDGWFQRAAYLEEKTGIIRDNWFAQDVTRPRRSDNELAICVRFAQQNQWQCEDDFHLISYPPPEYRRPSPNDVIDFLSRHPFEKVWFVTDHPGSGFFDALRGYPAEFFSEGEEEDIRFVRSFANVAFAWTAFDWWAAFLANAPRTWSLSRDAVRDLERHTRREWRPRQPVLPDLRVDQPNFHYTW